MQKPLCVSLGQHSDKGHKPSNQDCHGALIAEEPQLSTKGITLALADGISSSDVSHIASQTAVKGFLEDFYATPESWTIKTAASRVIQATNSWLYAQTRHSPNRYNPDRGYVCTFTALVLKSATAHIFHAGDARVYSLNGQHLEPLTEDHRLWVSSEKSYLSRALGMRDRVEIDYLTRPLEIGDLFLLCTDGVYEFMQESFVLTCLHEQANDLDEAAKQIIEHALSNGSEDNLTVQIVRIDRLLPQALNELQHEATILPFPSELRPRSEFDGYLIQRQLHHSNRSHIYLACDIESNQAVVLKTPSLDLRDDPLYIEHFLMEEWVARRLDNPHLLKPIELTRPRHFLYWASEFIEGQTLTQWMFDHPKPTLQQVRNIVEQIAKGLRALHRQEMLHQDLRPANIMIDKNGTVKIIDFGSVRLAGVAEMSDLAERQQILGTQQYTAPEYFIGQTAGFRSDQFSLGVIAYQMLSGTLPYGTAIARSHSKAAQNKLRYQPLRKSQVEIPIWFEEAIRKAVRIDPFKRYDELSEFIYDLHHPNPDFLRKERPPLLERDPLAFWQGLSLALFLIILFLLAEKHLT